MTMLNNLLYNNTLYNVLLGGVPFRTPSLKKAPYKILPHLWHRECVQQPQLFSHLLMHIRKKLGRGDVQSLWSPKDSRLFTMLHSFKWLCELRDFYDEESFSEEKVRSMAQEAMVSWACTYTLWNDETWESGLLAQRITHWVVMIEFLSDMSVQDQGCILDSLCRQTRHLAHIITYQKVDPPTLLLLLKGLAYGSLYFSGGERYRQRVLKLLLEKVTPRLILADGGCVERNPYSQYTHLLHFLEIYVLLKGLQESIPGVLTQTIAKMNQALQFFQHGDKRLCIFNGSSEGDSTLLEGVLEGASVSMARILSISSSGTPSSSLPKMQYERLAHHSTLVFMDVGSPPVLPFVECVHAGTLALEMSYKEYRVVVNCGTPPWYMEESQQPERRSTAAHSTLILNNTNSSDLSKKLDMKARYPRDVVLRKYMLEPGVFELEATHNGYRSNLGYLHRRKVILEKDGCQLRGEDRLLPSEDSHLLRGDRKRRKQVTPLLSFHLHPDVVPNVLPGGTKNTFTLGEQDLTDAKVQLWIKDTNIIWEFMAPSHWIDLERSQYWGTGMPQETYQIVVSESRVDGESMVFSWGFYLIQS